ncbi:MAG: hypothetical protein RLZZ511_1823 [Cyanobacteriota bacterium]|jgi:hypothetical protein
MNARQIVKEGMIQAMRVMDDPDQSAAMVHQLINQYGRALVDQVTASFSADPSQLPPDVLAKMAAAGIAAAQEDPEQWPIAQGEIGDAMAQILADQGITPIWQHFRLVDEGFVLSAPAWDVLSQEPGSNLLGSRPTIATLDDIGLPRSPYWHPLSEALPDEGGVNAWGAVSLLLDTILFNTMDGSPAQAKAAYSALVGPLHPTLDLEQALSRAVYDDRWLLKLTTIGVEAIDQAIANNG